MVGDSQRTKKQKNKKNKPSKNITLSQHVMRDNLREINVKNNKKKYIKKENNSMTKVNSQNKHFRANTMLPLLMCRRDSYTGDGNMNKMIEVIRNKAPAQVYIANCTTMSDIGYMRRNPAWHRISGEFGQMDTARQPDGIYLFPTFYGHYKAGHWLLTILKKRSSLWFGWTVDSITAGREARADFARKLIAKVVKQRIVWSPGGCFNQDEVECGPRTICHILVITQNINIMEIEAIIETFRNNEYLLANTDPCTAARQVCERMLNKPHHIVNLPFTSGQQDDNRSVSTNEVTSKPNSTTNIRARKKSKTIPNAKKKTDKSKRYKLESHKKIKQRHNRENVMASLSATFPTSISHIQGILAHIESRDGHISHLIATHNSHKVKIGIRNVRALSKNHK